MTNRRHATNHKARPLAHKIGIRFFYRLTGELAQSLLIYPICATGNYEKRLVSALAFEHQRFHNLLHATSNCLRCFPGSSR